MKVTGVEANFKTMVSGIYGNYRKAYPNVDETIWNKVENEFLSTSLDELVKLMAPVYYKYLTERDLKELIKFYKSPVGKKLVKNMPLIMQEGMKVGEEWGRRVGERVRKKLEEEGY